MKTSANKRGFTLIELLVAMAITSTIIVTLVSITSVAVDAWSRSRSEVRASRISQIAFESLTQDLSSAVIQKGNPYEWLSVENDDRQNRKAASAVRLAFFSAAPDRYDGTEEGSVGHDGGDICGIGYYMSFGDPLTSALGGGANGFDISSLYRVRVDPRETFEGTNPANPDGGLLAKRNLITAGDNPSPAFADFSAPMVGNQGSANPEADDFLAENIVGLSLSFLISYEDTNAAGEPVTRTKVATIGNRTLQDAASSVRVFGNRLEVIRSQTGEDQDLRDGKIESITIDLSVLSETGVQRLRNFTGGSESAEFSRLMSQETYRYTRTISLPGS